MKNATPTPSESLELPSGVSGLVTSATTGRESVVPDDAGELLDGLRSHFRFPAAELVAASAALFKCEAISEHTFFERAVSSFSNPGRREFGEALSWRTGPRPHLTIGPGVLRVSRVDFARSELAAERAREARTRDIDIEVEMLRRPMVFAMFGTGSTRVVTGWSAKSRARLIEHISALDLSKLASGERIPCMVTLTLPGDWLAVAPTAKRAAELLANLARAWQREWEVAPAWIWKREFQRRGAPHWHLWTVPPTSDSKAFRVWLSATWTRILNPSRELDRGVPHAVEAESRCACSEYCRSVGAGTGVDYAEGMRARDPRRLAIYFLKESLGGEGKAYQNGPPVEWAGHSVGRFWGVRGIKPATFTVSISPDAAERIWREMVKVRKRRSPVQTRSVERVDTATGRVYRRRVARRRVVFGSAGWVTVNDGAAFAAQLARLLDPPTREPWSPRSPATMPGTAVIRLDLCGVREAAA